jgi:membrane protein implicated in regulation of membrane protease activity
MSGFIYWILIGFILLIVELTTGTFYLLVLGMGAFAAAVAAWLGAAFWVQAAAGSVTALIGLVVVWRMRAADVTAVSSNTLDVGQRVTLEAWVDRASGAARVRYRNALWDARVTDAAAAEATADTFYIRNVAGSVLEVTRTPPA